MSLNSRGEWIARMTTRLAGLAQRNLEYQQDPDGVLKTVGYQGPTLYAEREEEAIEELRREGVHVGLGGLSWQ